MQVYAYENQKKRELQKKRKERRKREAQQQLKGVPVFSCERFGQDKDMQCSKDLHVDL